MSNSQVGPVYSAIINRVCESSQVDFEEGGVDQKTLEEMRTTWQKKLTMLGVAQFPWDPPPVAPQPQPVLQSNSTVPSNAPRAQAPTQNIPPNPPAVQNNPPQPQIKMEPGVPLPINNMGANPPNRAAQMAAQNLNQKYGAHAQAPIQALASGQHAQQMNARQPPPQQQYPQPGQPQQQPQQQPSHGHPAPQQPRQQPLAPGQVDGGGDEAELDPLAIWKAEVARRRAEMSQNNGHADKIIREHMMAMQSRMEGGGLMVSMEEREKMYGKGKKRAKTNLVDAGTQPGAIDGTVASSSKLPGPAQYDGGDEDEDEDAINSDLDDPDELEGGDEEDDDGNAGNVMLCTYEKVQRVKNKWKCTLKDGTLWTGNKEYIFHKGQGEFEW